MSEPQSTTSTTTVTWEIHAQMPDGAEGPITFMGTPAATYDSLRKAAYSTDRYTSEQIGWKKPLAERKRYFLVEVITTTTSAMATLPISEAEDGWWTSVDNIKVSRRRVREGISWYAEDGSDIDPAPNYADIPETVPHTSPA